MQICLILSYQGALITSGWHYAIVNERAFVPRYCYKMLIDNSGIRDALVNTLAANQPPLAVVYECYT